jgi:nitroreductase
MTKLDANLIFRKERKNVNMNNTIELLSNHTSIRSFTDQPLTQEQRDAIFKVANQTSSFSLLQAVSIIRVTDPNLRKQVMQLSVNQPYIEEAAEFWVFCADFNRNHQIAPKVDLDYIEYLLIGSFNGGLMAQNALTAAESMGLGGVYIGGVRANIAELTGLLNLPKYVVPLVGLCIGHPAGEKPGLKPRLPQSMVMFDNEYPTLDEEELATYDQRMREYYQNRPVSAPFTVEKVKGWRDHIEDHLERSILPFMLEYLNKQGFAKK